MSLFGSRSPRRKKTARKGKSRPAWLPWVLGGALLVTVLGVGGLKWAETGGGRATLLSLGSDQMYGEVQLALDQALVAVLPALAPGAAAAPSPEDPGRDCDWPLPAVGADARVRCRTVAVPDERTWWEIQERVAEAVQPAGGRVLWGERMRGARLRRGAVAVPDEQTDVLRLDVGVPGHPTHTLVLHRAGRDPRVRWGGGGETTAWHRLAAEPGPTVALIIDDWGNNRSDAARRILDLPAPLTLAVLPGLSYSRHFALQRTDLILPEPALAEGAGSAMAAARRGAGAIVEVAVAAGHSEAPARRREILLHMPMQPESYPEADPGADPLLVGMDAEGIAARIDAALTGLPGVTGLNNHMGSAATSDQPTMKALMGVLAARDLFFVDSVTSARSVAYEAARDAGLPAARNRIFLDYDNEDHGRIRANLERLVQSARATGFAVGIAHPHPATADVLARELPRLAAEGVRLVTVSELMALKQAAGKQ